MSACAEVEHFRHKMDGLAGSAHAAILGGLWHPEPKELNDIYQYAWFVGKVANRMHTEGSLSIFETNPSIKQVYRNLLERTACFPGKDCSTLFFRSAHALKLFQFFWYSLEDSDEAEHSMSSSREYHKKNLSIYRRCRQSEAPRMIFSKVILMLRCDWRPKKNKVG